MALHARGRSSFDPRLDEVLFSRPWVGINNGSYMSKIVVSVHSYSGGPPKLQITREKLNKQYHWFRITKLGRLTKEEVKGILPIVVEALQIMDQEDNSR